MALHRLTCAARLFRPDEFGLGSGRCPACGSTLLIRLWRRPAGVRCLRCRMGLVSATLIAVLHEQMPDLKGRAVYELSSRGAVVRYLRRSGVRLTLSEYLDGVAAGESRGGVRLEDVQALTWPDAHFDVCTSTEVFEHVPDDRRAFRELLRVLKPGGLLVFTVPLAPASATRERARLRDGQIEHLLPPEYHGDHLRGFKVLVYRDYGTDILQRLAEAGFTAATLHRFPTDASWFGFSRQAVSARKPG
jgi:SAM-dependent methyltransferase